VVESAAVYPHDGNPKETLRRALADLDLAGFNRIAATGRKFREYVNLTSIPEPEAVEAAYAYAKPQGIDCPAIISAGGETFMIYVLNRAGQIANVLTGNKCASGTGEFFLQQLRRMDVSLEEASQWAVESQPYQVSGRCSVFCKSDCTHATNKGVPKAKVTAGLCRMMANKILELLKKVENRNIMVTGGASRNQMMIEYLKKEIPGLLIPPQAPYFEALGAALWALSHATQPFPAMENLFPEKRADLNPLSPLKAFESRVQFKQMVKGTVGAGDTCILGLDVGSTTTKAVLLRKADDALLASIYLRTNGDPVGASRACYAAIWKQISAYADPKTISIIGLGICGSGRQIAGLHAFSEGVINEIIAHAAAAVYFDPKVDTIFEIGGQDAKYTYIVNGVPADYAMNEACSAGTGSFLEESAFETLGVRMEDIAEVALKGDKPPNFNDQCAAFIASDIKNAIHEGVRHEDIVAGLVYSICMNYTNRVKGNRPVGQKVFMQGGVCYNRAVPLAMAALSAKPIIVPPEPGLMGAFGAALVIKDRVDQGLLRSQKFDLSNLAERRVIYGEPFVCPGGKEKCDRRCQISRIQIEGQTYPFGGACNRYYNLRRKVHYDTQKLNLVNLRQHLIFEKYGSGAITSDPAQPLKRVAFNRSFLVHTYYPLYSTFFSELGFAPILPEQPSGKGIDLRNAAFCYPAELAHGFFHRLLAMDDPPQFIFLPHFKSIPSHNGSHGSQVCPFVQGETFYLRTTFREQLHALEARGTQILSPLLDLHGGLSSAEAPLMETAKKMGIRSAVARMAFQKALARQQACLDEMQAIGRRALAELAEEPEKTAVVLCARPYNGFAPEAHMGIPNKMASRGIMVIPMDFIPVDGQTVKRHMYWGMGQLILKTGRFIKDHPQLFGTYITNFSCGPDSFILGYFRSIMGRKPSLTLELDSHTADAGLETRIEAFLDIVTAYRQLEAKEQIPSVVSGFSPARTLLENDVPKVITSRGETLPMTHPRVTLLLPSMGKIASEALAAVFRGAGFHAKAHEPADEAILKLGRANTSCKECLPLILTTGTLLDYVQNRRLDDEALVYFMPTGSGPCRFGQYYIFMEDLVKRLKLADVALFSLSSENGYAGMGTQFTRRGWWAVIVSDVFEDIRSMLLANAKDASRAMALFETEWQKTLTALESGQWDDLERQLAQTAQNLARLPLQRPVSQVPVITLTGEIFVRRDALSRQNLTETLAQKGFATVCSPIAEWMHYADFLVMEKISVAQMSAMERFGVRLKQTIMRKDERRIKTLLGSCGLVHHCQAVDIESIVAHASPYISPNLAGEAILTVGSALKEVACQTCGVIAIGPFGCMPNRLSEAILNEVMNRKDKLALAPGDPHLQQTLSGMADLPFLAIESDGSPFPQLIQAKLEAFCLRAERLHARMIDSSASPDGG
jgi:predicted CoA-substrate-specific enzyme activase